MRSGAGRGMATCGALAVRSLAVLVLIWSRGGLASRGGAGA